MSSRSGWLRNWRDARSSLSGSQSRRGRHAGVRRGPRVHGLVLESLEPRTLLTGTWTHLAAPLGAAPGGTAVDNAQTMVLESDGTVMVQGGGDSPATAWYKLTPDGNGNYVNGTWSNLKAMNVGRLFYATNVLQDGRVFVVGGEKATDKNETNAAEIYSPYNNTWTSVAPYAQDSVGNNSQSQFGDGPSELLPDGRVLAGTQFGSQAYIFDPSTNAWTAAGTSSSGNFGEEGWVKLPDGSILDYKIGLQTAERFVLGATDAQDKWVPAGSVPVNLGSNGGLSTIGAELGPGLLLPNGNVFWIGASNQTAIYTPPSAGNPTGTWIQGPNIPNDSKGNVVGGFDAPGAVETNGKVLFAVSPNTLTTDSKGNPVFPSPTTFYEYDSTAPAGSQIVAVPNTNGPNLSQPAFLDRMLVLPSGQVLVSDASGQLYVYSPDSSPNAAWAPTISSITPNIDGSFRLTGTQLNGLDEGATYGDDSEMGSNYPIVQLTDLGGHVSFARTSSWSSTAVATGNTPVWTTFQLPSGDGPGVYYVSAIANGIASTPALVQLRVERRRHGGRRHDEYRVLPAPIRDGQRRPDLLQPGLHLGHPHPRRGRQQHDQRAADLRRYARVDRGQRHRYGEYRQPGALAGRDAGQHRRAGQCQQYLGFHDPERR